MSSSAISFADPPGTNPPDDPRLESVRARLEGLRATLALAQALAEAGERIDLAGLDEQVGPVCAAALDLPDTMARALRLDLVALGQQVGTLLATLRTHMPGAG